LRDTGRTLTLDLGLEVVLGAAVGLKVFAAGFGLKSLALTLNLEETADVGVRTVLDACELGTGPAFTEGLLGGFETLWIGSGAGMGTGMPALCLPWLSARRWLSMPWLFGAAAGNTLENCCCLSRSVIPACGPRGV